MSASLPEASQCSVYLPEASQFSAYLAEADSGPSSASSEDARDTKAAALQAAFGQSYTDLVYDTWKENKLSGQTGDELDWTRSILFVTMISIPWSLVDALIEGRVYQAFLNNIEVNRTLVDNLKQNNRPSIYYQEISGNDGLSLAKADAVKVIQHFRIYIVRGKLSGRDRYIIKQIDNQIDGIEQKDPQLRRYLRSSNNKIVVGRVQKVEIFCRENEARFRSKPDHNPLNACWSEVGYAASPIRRHQEHREHRRSNFLLNLLESTCRYLFDGEYGLRQFVVLPLFGADQAALAEEFITLLTSAYIDNGGGVNHHLAGRSNASAYRLSDSQWNEYAEEVFEGPLFKSNWEIERQYNKDLEQRAELCEKILNQRQKL